jgi:hypothetical protein
LSGEAFLIVPLSLMLTFAVLFIAAVANTSRPERHKRLMLLATVSLLNAGGPAAAGLGVVAAAARHAGLAATWAGFPLARLDRAPRVMAGASWIQRRSVPCVFSEYPLSPA